MPHHPPLAPSLLCICCWTSWRAIYLHVFTNQSLHTRPRLALLLSPYWHGLSQAHPRPPCVKYTRSSSVLSLLGYLATCVTADSCFHFEAVSYLGSCKATFSWLTSLRGLLPSFFTGFSSSAWPSNIIWVSVLGPFFTQHILPGPPLSGLLLTSNLMLDTNFQIYIPLSPIHSHSRQCGIPQTQVSTCYFPEYILQYLPVALGIKPNILTLHTSLSRIPYSHCARPPSWSLMAHVLPTLDFLPSSSFYLEPSSSTGPSTCHLQICD